MLPARVTAPACEPVRALQGGIHVFKQKWIHAFAGMTLNQRFPIKIVPTREVAIWEKA